MDLTRALVRKKETLKPLIFLEEKEVMNRCSEKFHAQFTGDTKVFNKLTTVINWPNWSLKHQLSSLTNSLLL